MTGQLELITPYLPVYSEPIHDTQNNDKPNLLAGLLAGDFSALYGGSHPALKADEKWPRCETCANRTPLVPYLQINLSTECTPAEFRNLVPPLRPDGVTLFQVFVCTAYGENPGNCFEDWISGAAEGKAWLVRVVHFDGDADGLLASEAAEFQEAQRSLVTELVPTQRIVATWTPENPEVPHRETLFQLGCTDYDEEFYDAHEPVSGLKLLGHAILGMVENLPGDGDQEEGCSSCNADHSPDSAWSFRCLVQLGTDVVDDCDESEFMTSGNTYVLQCTRHPYVFQGGRSFSW
ncbi:hypothetical protein PYCCODRAFT_1434657 [Trametes coccinea BRFM310]|uniref:Programmed cell death protein 2 C-terminal domain-containing protein n=1 Tax=Trametes coccinea (strain BRFM310) TaxID=1353009 RepID=A0A1Y2ITG3_TRAC3|nr:hypothetical protein PYCCODRAFT_1434657 [Trametes coccinea BRFM310]